MILPISQRHDLCILLKTHILFPNKSLKREIPSIRVVPSALRPILSIKPSKESFPKILFTPNDTFQKYSSNRSFNTLQAPH
ncbi:hypothetical protein CEXT_179691 [Caerostris extrusa]|uniref:Uncharacterized protein n=1 Tax=Caerostris extrusa TaxID=172846 RepID=A0AAV4WDQ0_CAEEX|nr:hypothetical protein CEXT_179691 [Caerostris extrusa]